jgi:2-C-methyl-D-erythritol 4-phosphate cytidylyltransferase
VFSVLLVTAAPPGLPAEAGGAFVKIDGREALLRSVELFLNREHVKQVQLVIAVDAMEEAKRKYGPHLGFTGVKLVSGGNKWLEQVAAAADRISPEATHVILHDAARPAVPYSDIDALMEAAEKHEAVVLASPVRNVLAEVDEGGNAMAWHLPGQFMNLLTPQAFTRDKFLEMAKSQRELHPSQVTLVKGSSLNVRAGGPGEAGLVKTMLNMLPKPKVRPPSSPFEEAQW